MKVKTVNINSQTKKIVLSDNTIGNSFAFQPRRAASWWSKLEDLLWPEKKARDMIRRRADALAEADVDTVIQFGFHYRFDFAPYFGAMHGLFAEIADILHERKIRFLDHYSCNVIGRPNSAEERLSFHTCQRHVVCLYPDPVAAATAGYAGYRFNDLREIDLLTGGPAYTPIYQGELFCHNNPDFRAMHAAYLERLFAEVALDGIQVDDMCLYNWFRSCGCPHCRERFRRECGEELPPLTERSFWGEVDGGKTPAGVPVAATGWLGAAWGNYANPAFQQWVQMRYRYVAEHLAGVRRVIGPDKALMTCCSCSGPRLLNAGAISYERFIRVCDWVMLENCGLGMDTVRWQPREPNAMLQKAIGETRSPAAPAIGCSYTVYEDGAYLSWAIARFWGAVNWISTLTQGLAEDPGDTKEEAELIKPFNVWEKRHSDLGLGQDVVEVRVAFLKAGREEGWMDDQGKDYWSRVERWALALARRNMGYRFILHDELGDPQRLLAERTPVVLDPVVSLTEAQRRAVAAFMDAGGQVWVTAAADLAKAVVLAGPEALDEEIRQGRFTPRIRQVAGADEWALRFRLHDGRLVLHLLNRALKGLEHPQVMDRWGKMKILHRMESVAEKRELAYEMDLSGLSAPIWKNPGLMSPEWTTSRPVQIQKIGERQIRLILKPEDLLLYGVIDEITP